MQQQVQDGSDQMKTVLGVVHAVCGGLASILEVPLHRWDTMGERYFGLRPAVALLSGLFYTAFWRGANVVPVLALMAVYVVLCCLARVRISTRVRSGGVQAHSFSSGTPRIMRFARGMTEETVRRLVEPMLAFMVGVLLLQVNEPLGTFVMLASFGLFAAVNLAAGFDRTRSLDMHDAYLDQCSAAERFRQMHGQ